MKDIIQSISESYSFVGEGVDMKGNPYTFEKYSLTIQVLPSCVEELKKYFPNFSIFPLYLNYYTVGFNKKLKL